jgi:threonine dehydratase
VVPGGTDLADLLADLGERGYITEDMTNNEVAKLHIRYMVGGHAPAAVNNECVYRVEFPERPGALLRFLAGLGSRWNISMFHYRNHGAAYGRILVGVQLPKGERRAFEQILDELKFPYYEETQNRAYQLYLGNRPA